MNNILKNIGDQAVDMLKALFLHKRMKSLYWTTAAMLVATLTDVLPQIFIDFNTPNFITVFIGLVLAQITKHLNTKV